jgi:hypothetical protein
MAYNQGLGEGNRRMSKNWIFGLVLILLACIVTAYPNYQPPTISSTGNGTLASFNTNWYSNTSNLSCFIFQSDNSGTATNESEYCWSGGTEGWSNVTLTLNTTPGLMVSWIVYANDSDGWNTSSNVLIITQYNAPPYQTAICPVTTSLQNTLLFIAIGIFLLALFIISEVFKQLPPIFGFLPAFGMVFYSLPLFGCHIAYGLITLIFGVLILLNAWQKAFREAE